MIKSTNEEQLLTDALQKIETDNLDVVKKELEAKSAADDKKECKTDGSQDFESAQFHPTQGEICSSNKQEKTEDSEKMGNDMKNDIHLQGNNMYLVNFISRAAGSFKILVWQVKVNL